MSWTRLAVLAFVLVVGACDTPPQDPATLARQAILDSPDDPAPRLALARLHLREGRGDLAEVLLDQAIARGAAASTLAPERAEALLLTGKTEALFALPLPDSAVERLHVLSFRARAEPSDVNYLAVYNALDQAPDADIRAWIDRQPDSERARAHHACAIAPPTPSEGWRPRPHPGPAIRVGSVAELQEAARTAPDGALVVIEDGFYAGGVAKWSQSNLTVRGINGRPHITANGKSVERRDVWLFTGDNVLVENVEISGARSPYKNGASIRFIGENLTLRGVFLHDSENGLLTGNNRPDSRILIEYAEFADNGDGEGFAHNIYIGYSGEFILRYSHSHRANVGHIVKSRAARTEIGYNRLADDEKGRSSRTIDLPDGGAATVIGNVIDHGANSENKTIIGYGTESSRYTNDSLRLVHNTFYNRYLEAIALDNRSEVRAQIANNLFAGAPLVRLNGPGELIGNVDRAEHGLTDPRNGDFSLMSGSPAIDAGADLASAGMPVPTAQYVHPLGVEPRRIVYRPDVGAYERCGF